uniref:Uncharacterized protein n=1 Tax=Arundo donax TaxID=35708 RepID=A0A0A9AC61_ARUDO
MSTGGPIPWMLYNFFAETIQQ